MDEIEHRVVEGERVAFLGETSVPVWHVVVETGGIGDLRRAAGRLDLPLAAVRLALRYADSHVSEIGRAMKDRAGGNPPSLRRPRLRLARAETLLEAAPTGQRAGG